MAPIAESWHDRFRRLRDEYIARGISHQEAAEYAREEADEDGNSEREQ